MNVEIAERLAQRRREAGLSQEALADKLGVTRQAVSKWERSESSPDTDNLIALAELYGVSLDDLLYVDASIKDDVAFESQDKAQGTQPQAASDDVGQAGSEGGEPKEQPYVSFKDGIHIEEPGGEKVHISWLGGINVEDGEGGRAQVSLKDGIHVVDSSGEKVHVSLKDGVRFESPASESQHFCGSGWYDSDGDWHDDKGGWHGRNSAWLKFPLPVLVTIIYLLLGFLLDAWMTGFLVFLAIPIYYTLVDCFIKHRIAPIFQGLYPLAATAWFLYMWLVIDQPHPAWIIFLTIPIWEWAAHGIRNWYRRRKQVV